MPYGQWTEIIRELTGYDPARGDVVFRTWPLRTLLLAYLNTVVKPRAQRGWELSITLWQIRVAFGGSKEKPPPIPRILDL